MKKTILFAMAAILTLVIYAQRPDRPMNDRGMQNRSERMGSIRQELNLTEAQQKQMHTLNEDFRTKMKTLRDNESITVKEQRDQMYKLGQEHHKAMKNVLTTEQQQKMASLREERGKRMQERQGRHFEKVAADLKLTDAQKTQLKQIHEKHMASVKTVAQNDGLDRTARQTTMKNLVEQHKKELTKVLSKEQYEQWEKMRNDEMRNGRQGMGRRGQSRCSPGMQAHGKGYAPVL